MRFTGLAAACLVVAGCAKEPVEVAEAPPPELTRDDCYTVVLFDDVDIVRPGPDVPAEYHGFVGNWQKGAWDGKWCHDVLISKVGADGSAELFEMHAPYAEWGQPASAFKRKGRFDESGNLRFRYDTEVVTYKLVDGRLHARRSGRFGDLVAVLVNGETVRRDAAGVPVGLDNKKAEAPRPAEPDLDRLAAAEPSPVPAAPADIRSFAPLTGFTATE